MRNTAPPPPFPPPRTHPSTRARLFVLDPGNSSGLQAVLSAPMCARLAADGSSLRPLGQLHAALEAVQ